MEGRWIARAFSTAPSYPMCVWRHQLDGQLWLTLERPRLVVPLHHGSLVAGPIRRDTPRRTVPPTFASVGSLFDEILSELAQLQPRSSLAETAEPQPLPAASTSLEKLTGPTRSPQSPVHRSRWVDGTTST
ncbi:hypothetical protein, variant [Aphanomyces invadans]|uniref:Uncharacterized protein n=1 Tax=Aphanomyces invadans TaxID=157072 RepID=A0A024TLW1_9STRA|nr:hypothetical protein, variant [Aphanomyces invadans]XP_008876186.1 hypothetical protein H310_11334 [Aphanomyces invadans]ETV95012.1 hypothetical protein H310_11334 [Aphanomyces invadans]ETV95013.1 hypothetical protein, variant [Aphanomyces invadans]|eukprot:XP_008876185.1 hypothetical protein, variant [Aphanomyces invadans]